MEVQINEEIAKKVEQFLTKVSLERVSETETEYLVKFDGRLYQWKIQVSEVLGYLLLFWYMTVKAHDKIEAEQAKTEKSGYAI